MDVVKEFLYLILLCILIACGLMRIAIFGTEFQKSRSEEIIAKCDQLIKEKEVKVKSSELEVSLLRSDVERVRLRAFLNAYSHGNYFVEIESFEEKE